MNRVELINYTSTTTTIGTTDITVGQYSSSFFLLIFFFLVFYSIGQALIIYKLIRSED